MALEVQKSPSLMNPCLLMHTLCSIIHHVYQPARTALVTARHKAERVNPSLCTTKLNMYFLSPCLNPSSFVFSMLSYFCLTNFLSVELLAFCWLARLMWWEIKSGSPPFSSFSLLLFPFQQTLLLLPCGLTNGCYCLALSHLSICFCHHLSLFLKQPHYYWSISFQKKTNTTKLDSSISLQCSMSVFFLQRTFWYRYFWYRDL